MQRVQQLAGHLAGTHTTGLPNLKVKRPDDVVITLAIRSPLCKAKKGAFKDARWEHILNFNLDGLTSDIAPTNLCLRYSKSVQVPGGDYLL